MLLIQIVRGVVEGAPAFFVCATPERRVRFQAFQIEPGDADLADFIRYSMFEHVRLDVGGGREQTRRVHTLADMATKLNRSTVYLSGLQKRFELPTCEGATYPDAYLEFFRRVVYLRTFGVSEESLRDLWVLEKKLLTLLHVDSTGSWTWFLDACGRTTHRERRLMLSNFDLGIPLDAREVQTGLDFSDRLPELFEGKAMGEDALRVLDECLKLEKTMLNDVRAELPHVREAVKWAGHLPK